MRAQRRKYSRASVAAVGAGMPVFLREPSSSAGGPVVPALAPIVPVVQRFPKEGETAPPAPAIAPDSTASPATISPVLGLIVEDSVAALAPGQMTKSQFLYQLRAAVCATAEEALPGTIWSVVGCPWADHADRQALPRVFVDQR